MKFKEIIPGERLRPYVKCFFVVDSEIDVTITDTILPGGCVEFVFNLGEIAWKSATDNGFQSDPPVELLGQVTRPIAIKGKGKNYLLGIRFFAHTAAYFFKDNLSAFNNQVTDGRDVLGGPVRLLYARLLETPELDSRIELIEQFLVDRLSITEGNTGKILMMGKIVKDMERNLFSEDMETIAARYNISSRYLQKLFLQHIGVTPKLYGQINRFQRSLRHINKNEASLTSIAYDCGYADQSHFIREFKTFTGTTPSAYVAGYPLVNQPVVQ